jgi:hypothetical protein
LPVDLSEMRATSVFVLFVPRWTITILAAVGTALFLVRFVAANNPNAAEDNINVTTDDVHVCSSTNVTDHNSCANHNNENENHQYEPPEIEWCRRRPLWRIGTNGVTPNNKEDVDIRERCQNVLGYVPDLEALTEGIEYELSSTFDIVRHKERFSSSNNSDNNNEDDDEEYSAKTYHELPVLERPLLKELGACIENFLANIPKKYRTTTTNSMTMKRPRVSKLHRRRDGRVVMAVVENALSEEEADAVLALAQCERQLVPYSFERRGFEQTEEGGGNDVTYMAGFLQLLAPGVAYRILRTAHLVWNAAGWSEDESMGLFEPVDLMKMDEDEDKDKNEEDKEEIEEEEKRGERLAQSTYSTRWWPDPLSESGIRTTEHLSYDTWGGLGYHYDAGSDYTILAALSNPDDYEGGSFSLCPENEADEDNFDAPGGPECTDKISVKPNRLAAIVFLSDYMHGVEDITTPGRVMFANELWRYGDTPAMTHRPPPNDFVLGTDDYYSYDAVEVEDEDEE